LKLHNLKFHVLGLAVTVAVAEAHAADWGSDPHDSSFALSIQAPQPEPLFFWQRFNFAFDNEVNDRFADTLQPLNAIRWNIDLRGRDFSDNFRERASSRARFAFTRTVQYGLREAAVDFPFMIWLDDHQTWFANLLRDSVANVSEEYDGPVDLSYRGVEQSWWRNLSEGGTHFGVRPLRTSPYAYVSHGITDGDRTILLTHVRYYYDRFSDHRVEFAFSVPLEYGMAFDFASAYKFGARENVVVKLLKELKGGGVAHVGFEVKQHPALIAGISFGW
jgi:hypothetical protein